MAGPEQLFGAGQARHLLEDDQKVIACGQRGCELEEQLLAVEGARPSQPAPCQQVAIFQSAHEDAGQHPRGAHLFQGALLPGGKAIGGAVRGFFGLPLAL